MFSENVRFYKIVEKASLYGKNSRKPGAKQSQIQILPATTFRCKGNNRKLVECR